MSEPAPRKVGRPRIPRTPEYIAQQQEKVHYYNVRALLHKQGVTIPDGQTTVDMITGLQAEIATLKQEIVRLQATIAGLVSKT